MGSVRYRAMAAADAQGSCCCRLLSSSTRNEYSSCYWKPVDGTTVATATGGVAPPCGASTLVSTTVATAGMAPPLAAVSTATAVATRLFCGYATGTSACSAGCCHAPCGGDLVHSCSCRGQWACIDQAMVPHLRDIHSRRVVWIDERSLDEGAGGHRLGELRRHRCSYARTATKFHV